jgi:hypothetical protein
LGFLWDEPLGIFPSKREIEKELIETRREWIDGFSHQYLKGCAFVEGTAFGMAIGILLGGILTGLIMLAIR